MDWLKERRARRRKAKHEASLLDSKITSTASEQHGETTPKDVPATQPTGGSNLNLDLWGQALDRLEGELLSQYKGVLIEEGYEDGSSKNENSDELLGRIVTNKVDEIEKDRLRYTFKGKEHSVNQQLGKVVQGILGLKEYITVAVSPDPHASLAWSGVLVILPVILRPWTEEDAAQDGFTYIADYLIRCKVIEDEYKKVRSNRFLSTNSTAISNRQRLHESYIAKTVVLYTQILEYQIRLVHHLSRSGLIRAFADLTVKDGWKGLAGSIEETEKGIVSVLNDLDRATLHNIDQGVETIYELGEKALGMLNELQGDVKVLRQGHTSEKENRSLERLSQLYVTGASFESETTHKSCLQGTRVSLLDKIQEWATDCQGQQILWLNGIAGTGKSTIAKTVASTLADQGYLGGSYFFSNGSERAHAQLFFRTLAVQLVQLQTATRTSIAQVVSNHLGIDDLTPKQQWTDLLHGPLAQCSLSKPVVMVIDALDECDLESHIKEILKCLSQTRDVPWLRVFITGRPRLTRFFDKIPSSLLRVVNLSDVDGSENDISQFLKYRLGEIKGKWSEEDDDWPDENALLTLEHNAGRLFIYASTACSFVDSFYYKNRLSEILNNDRPGLSELDKLYTKALEKALPTGLREEEQREFITSFCNIIGTVVILAEPLSMSGLGQLLGQENIKQYVSRLSSVLDVPNSDAPIRTFHLSFPDFLLDHNRQGEMFWVHDIQIHSLLVNRSLEILGTTLKESIFQLTAPLSAEAIDLDDVKQYLPPHAQYACLYLARHVVRSDGRVDLEIVATFMKEHLLPWLKALDLIQRLQPTIQISGTLEEMEGLLYFRHAADQINAVIHAALKNKDYSPLLLLLSVLWKSRDIRRSYTRAVQVKLGQMLISVQYLCGDSTGALLLAKDMTYNFRRMLGSHDPWTSNITCIVSQLYTSIGQGPKAESWEMASKCYKKAAGLHAKYLRSLSEESWSDNDGNVKSKDQIRRHLYLLRLAVQRLGSWPAGRSRWDDLKSAIMAADPTLLSVEDDIENWHLESFGSGRAEADDDLFVPELNDEELFV
ncbi:hypothetical protein BDW59DRAFT_147633 [Aspergillus cavernicola]|uniref:NACHT domain-containing protein n=1 Tax=Aspergillus cavernicola TaxID=176166 RepID=A0ABR4I9J5_9EURO